MNLNLPKIYYGEGAIKNLHNILKGYKKVLMITGKGSIRRSGLYDELIAEVNKSNVELVEFWGIKPNPTRAQMNEASKLGIKEKIDFIIAAGGGSAIDASKIIASMIANPSISDSWNFIEKNIELKNTPIDIASIITMAGTASENNAGTVITNEETKLKVSTSTRAPIFAIEDPKYTLTVNPWQTASGVFDSFSHLTEQWFSLKGSFGWTDNYIIAQLKTLIKYGPMVVKDPLNLNARSNVLITTTMALNGLASLEMPDADWSVHQIAHSIAAIYNSTHGALLALISPSHWEVSSSKFPKFKKRVLELGKKLWGVNSFEDTIKELRAFISQLNLPTSFKNFQGLENVNEEIIDKFLPKVSNWIKLSKEDVKKIFIKLL